MSFKSFIQERGKLLFLLLLLAGSSFLIGGISLGSLVQYSSTNDFCLSCHEMTIVYEEFKQTSHFRNPSGVRPGCADCHIPHDWMTTLQRKMLASKDLLHHWLGTIDTEEKFEARRLHMAETVWARLKENDSAACRNCHSFDAMQLEEQRRRARKQHENAQSNGETCIDCHKGIAHKPVHKKETEENADEAIELMF